MRELLTAKPLNAARLRLGFIVYGDLLPMLLPLRPEEIKFLDRLNDNGEIAPELLTPDTDMQQRLRNHPGLRWKAFNVRRHHGLEDEDSAPG